MGYKTVRPLLVIVLLVSLGAPAVASTDEEGTDTDVRPCHTWSVSKDGTHRGYLFGTLYVKGKQMMRAPRIRKALRASSIRAADALLTEAELRPMEIKMLRRKKFQVDRPLKKRLPQGLYRDIGRLGDKYDVAIDGLDTTPTFLIPTVLPIHFAKLKPKDALPLDLVLQQIARHYNTEIFSIEDLGAQEKRLKTLYEKHGDTMIRSVVEYYRENNIDPGETLRAMIEAYRTCDEGEFKTMARRTRSSISEAVQSDLKAKLFDRQSQLFADAFHKYATTNPNRTAVMAVGAAHFYREPTVQSHLEKRGYTVEKIGGQRPSVFK